MHLPEDLGTIYMAGPDIGQTEIDCVVDALRNGWYGKSAYAYVESFERQFAEFHSRKYALMTPNCTTAIHLTLLGLGIGKGDQVIVPESTWIGSSAGINHAGAETVFADVEERTWCVSTKTIEQELTSRTRAVIAVDLYGNMPDWNSLEESCERLGIPIIEDAAEALGSRYRERRAGNFGIASVFSFHRTKTLSTGEGGMMLTDDAELFERCRFLRDHGREPGSYFNTEVAYKYMPFNVQAALGYGQLLRIEELIHKKRHIFETYRQSLPDDGTLQINLDNAEVFNGAWTTTVVLAKETGLTTDFLMRKMSDKGIPTRPFFYPLSSLPAYSSNHSGTTTRHPISYDLASRGIHLPCAMNLTDAQIHYVADQLSEIIKGN